MEEKFKILWTSRTTGNLKKFVFDDYIDDPVNRRYVFMDTNKAENLTINYDDIAWMITSPVIKE